MRSAGRHQRILHGITAVIAAACALAPAAALAQKPAAAQAQKPPTARPPASAQQQQQQHPANDDVAALMARSGGFSATVEMVRVPVIVVDDDGDFIRNLGPDAFAVRDGGKRYDVDHFVSDADPVAVGILLDASAVMGPFEQDVRTAVARIAYNLRPQDELFLISYGPGVAMLQPPTDDKDAVVDALDDYALWNGADRALHDAVDRGLRALEQSRFDKRSLIIIGAGGDTASNTGELAVQQHIHRTGVTIHAISLAPRSRRGINAPAFVNRLQTLPEIVEFTGGLLARKPQLTARFGGVSGWIATAGNDISNYVKHQYLLHYTPLSPPRPGTWREIRVEVAGRHHEVRARSGYMR
jgi:VWFA-related protein